MFTISCKISEVHMKTSNTVIFVYMEKIAWHYEIVVNRIVRRKDIRYQQI